MRFVCNCSNSTYRERRKGEEGEGGRRGKGGGGGGWKKGEGGGSEVGGLRICHNYVAGKYGHTVALVLIVRIELRVFLEFANF